MARLCTSYLKFECFSSLDESHIKSFVSEGAYAFQEYATLNWIYHSDLVLNLDIRCTDGAIAALKQSCLVLISRHEVSKELANMSSEEREPKIQNLSPALTRFRSLYETVHTISTNEESENNSLSSNEESKNHLISGSEESENKSPPS